MSKFPEPTGIDALRRIKAKTIEVPAGALFAHIYFATGPTPHAGGAPKEQDRAILYCALDVDTCAAEVFQATRRIDRMRNAPTLVVFALQSPLTLLDLRGAFATTIGASMAIHSGPRSHTRAWARQLHEAYPTLHGVHYGSSMNGYAPAVALNERAQQAIPERPQFHRAPDDDLLVEVLQRIALRLSCGLR